MPRPRKKIDENFVKELGKIHCTDEEICHILKIHKATLYRRFATILEEARSSGKMSLKRKRFQVALDGNVPMLIWLSKVLFGEKDQVEHSVEKMPEEAFSKLAEQVAERIRKTSGKDK